MKRFLCVIVVLVLCCGGLFLVACGNKPLDKVAKNCDKYTIVCAYDSEAHALSAVQTVQVTNRSENSFDSIKFHLYANQYREDAIRSVVPSSYTAIAYPSGVSYGEVSIDSVKLNGTPVAFVIEGEDMDILSVPTGEWFPDQTATVEITYCVRLANIRHRLGWTENVVNLGNFYPVLCNIENGQYQTTPYYNIGDPFVSQVANYEVLLRVEEQYIVASSGNLVEAQSENGFVTYKYSAQAVRDFALVCSKNFSKISKTIGDTTVSYYYFADKDSQTSLDTALGAFEYYTKNIGEYPYKQLSVVETDFCYGGMEYPCLTMITSQTKYYQEAIAHEVAHQWFYATVGNDQIANAWMDEGLVEYLTYLYMDNANEKKLSQSMMENMRTYTTYVDVLNNFYNNVDTTYRSLDQYKNDNEYVVMTYVKGSLMFNTLYDAMGEGKFFRALSNYYNEAAFTIAPPSQMIECFVDVGGKEIANIFNNYAEGKEILGQITD